MEGRGRWRGAPLPFLFQREPDHVGDELPEVRHVGTAVGARHHTEQLVDGSEGGRAGHAKEAHSWREAVAG